MSETRQDLDPGPAKIAEWCWPHLRYEVRSCCFHGEWESKNIYRMTAGKRVDACGLCLPELVRHKAGAV